MSRVVEGRRNRCTRQRDANRRALFFLFFLFSRPFPLVPPSPLLRSLLPSPPSPPIPSPPPPPLTPLALLVPFRSPGLDLSSSSPLGQRTLPLSLSNLLAFIAAATWLPVVLDEEKSGGEWRAGIFGRTFRTIEKSIRTRAILSTTCRCCRASPFVRFLFFGVPSCRRMIDDAPFYAAVPRVCERRVSEVQD